MKPKTTIVVIIQVDETEYAFKNEIDNQYLLGESDPERLINNQMLKSVHEATIKMSDHILKPLIEREQRRTEVVLPAYIVAEIWQKIQE